MHTTSRSQSTGTQLRRGLAPWTTWRPDHADDPLTAEGLRCSYGAFEAVRGVDLTVRRGELFALLGTNGAGKTTTLETLQGQRTPDAGHVIVLGYDPAAERRRLAAHIGVMFQQSGLPDDLTPQELLAMWIRLTPGAPSHLDPDAALTRVELDHRAGVRIRQLSGGERRRLDLALALINRPELVFLDEPTTGMDPQARLRTWQIIQDLRAEGATILLTTHHLEEAEALADRLAIMHEGRLAAVGTLTEIVAAHPARIQAHLPRHVPAPPAVEGELHVDPSGRITMATRALQADLTRLLRWAEDHRVPLADLQATEASLAQVFHTVAGTVDDPARTDLKDKP